MKYLQKTWVRIIISLLGAGMVAEIININSSDPNHVSTPDKSSVYVLPFAIAIFIILTVVVKNNEGKI